jgi:hypothetical protein
MLNRSHNYSRVPMDLRDEIFREELKSALHHPPLDLAAIL